MRDANMGHWGRFAPESRVISATLSPSRPPKTTYVIGTQKRNVLLDRNRAQCGNYEFPITFGRGPPNTASVIITCANFLGVYLALVLVALLKVKSRFQRAYYSPPKIRASGRPGIRTSISRKTPPTEAAPMEKRRRCLCAGSPPVADDPPSFSLSPE